MDLLPTSHTEFSQPDYWDRFFKKRGKIPFEWYGEYPQLSHVIHKYITPSNLVLVVGCGNSALSENMYDNGLQNLVNIDISDVVIRQMTDRHKVKRPKMTFEKVDVTQMAYTDMHFNAVLDKGTLDALLVSEEKDVIENIHRMFAEVCRCLKLGGRYVIISLLQDHVQRTLLRYFTELSWPIRIHRIHMEAEGGGQDSLSMPVFAVVITKLKSIPGMPQIVEVCRYEDRVDRLEDVKYLSEIVRDMQYYHIVRQQLAGKMSSDQQITLELHTPDSNMPRYSLTVVDSPDKMENKFAIFIVPQGRETEWLFSTDKGRLHLTASAGFQRLVVVGLGRGHEYDNLEAIKAELSLKVMELAPPKCPPRAQVPFLSIGEDIGRRFPVARGRSTVSGEYLVEDVELNGGQLYRRLIFLDNKNIIQSEARLKQPRKKKKRRQKGSTDVPSEGPPDKLRVDKGYLPSDYLIAFVGGLAFLPKLDSQISCLLVGLGGGGLPCFLHDAWTTMSIEAVELDPSVVEVARDFFDLVPDDSDRLRVTVADGLDVVRTLASQGEKRDVIIIDVDSKDNSVGLSCPPLAFVEKDFLEAIGSLLSPEGIFLLNLASRDEELGKSVLDRIALTFTSCGSLKLEEDVNTIVYAAHCTSSSPAWQRENLDAAWREMDAKIRKVWPDTNVELQDMMSGLTLPDT
ncbi:eEF1A lysine and N-terminal methyltransferase [Aplysia californica]|uniref:EEF1A lysine and N-terminal methyltransferase n=1 Tax=Aplysia californica TaxID=6500 RepID=A0ABM1VXD8_APLCA|nr:eEF1A lysine and N-terminal methyltransferase [Aplysia californica]XP_035827078.1 eEF1A lysine and N-terminal methyltransferase [Aplysia californica]XP_035827079.1 eEF1A lysine and N-terminal methyltransferase [Aplysia californica]XP_035827080.1 eEF1A lysine and N-terminal methyltransferase [Aplysia californica]XP_035827081.1 eEF1A lysine and N-terminal methyltransferase [Aplysia californica]